LDSFDDFSNKLKAIPSPDRSDKESLIRELANDSGYNKYLEEVPKKETLTYRSYDSQPFTKWLAFFMLLSHVDESCIQLAERD